MKWPIFGSVLRKDPQRLQPSGGWTRKTRRSAEQMEIPTWCLELLWIFISGWSAEWTEYVSSSNTYKWRVQVELLWHAFRNCPDGVNPYLNGHWLARISRQRNCFCAVSQEALTGSPIELPCGFGSSLSLLKCRHCACTPARQSLCFLLQRKWYLYLYMDVESDDIIPMKDRVVYR